MSETYTVVQGDHISGVAQKFGFGNPKLIWDAPENRDLTQKRDNPHVLLPGDQIYIPDRMDRTEPAPTTMVSTFQVTLPPLLLRVALKDFDNLPLAGTECVLSVDGAATKLTTDGDGIVQLPISRSAKDATLGIPDLGLELPVQIGFLNPVDDDFGWLGRLVNLGYYAGSADDSSNQEISFALEEFQCDQGLQITGLPDAATQAKLKTMHGA